MAAKSMLAAALAAVLALAASGAQAQVVRTPAPLADGNVFTCWQSHAAKDCTLAGVQAYLAGKSITWGAKQSFLASSVGGSGINCGQGSAPSSPVNGDVWCTSSGVFAQLGGVTYQLGGSAFGVSSFNGRAGAVVPTAADVTGALTYTPKAHVANKAALAAQSTAVANVVSRDGFAAPGDAPPLTYVWNASVCTLGAGAGDGGAQVQATGGGCWIAAFPPGPLDVREWGVVADGATDNTAALQAAWTYGGTINTDILLPPSNPTAINGVSYVKFSQLTAPVGTYNTSLANSEGPLSGIIGRGDGQTTLKSTVSGTQCAITFSAPAGANYGVGSTGRKLKDFQLIQQAGTYSGYGVCTNAITGLEWDHVAVQGFAYGMHALDTIRVSMDTPEFIANTIGIVASQSLNGSNACSAGYCLSRPNQWVIKNPQVFDQGGDSFLFFNASDILVLGGDFEGNNPTNTLGDATIQMQGNPIDGVRGLTVIGGYYQINGGDADFEFVQTAATGPTSATIPIAQNAIYGVEEGKVSGTTFVQHSIAILNSQPSQQTRVEARGNSFWYDTANGYVPSSARTFLFVLTPSNNNTQITGYSGNTFSPGVEAPGICVLNTNCINDADGHIEEWGSGVTSGGSAPYTAAVTWPLACPTAVDSFVVSVQDGSITGSTESSGTPTTTGATIYSNGNGVGMAWSMRCH